MSSFIPFVIVFALLLVFVAFVLYAYFHDCKRGNHRTMFYCRLPAATITRCWVCGHYGHYYHRGAQK